MKTKTKRLLKKAGYITIYIFLITQLILIGNLMATIALSTLFTALLIGLFYRDYRLEHADLKEKNEMLKQMQSDNRRYYRKGRDFADSTRLEYERKS